jgi:hypothetical protein
MLLVRRNKPLGRKAARQALGGIGKNAEVRRL